MRLACFLLVVLLSLGQTNPAHAQSEKVTITFIVTAPRETDPAASLFIACRLPGSSDWQPNAIPLRHSDSGEWRGKISVPKGHQLDFKITGGSWDTVEKGELGEEIDNRVVTCDRDRQETIVVLKWRQMPSSQPITQPIEKRASTATGDIRTITLHSKILKTDRKLHIWLPPGYGDKADRYPVLYMHDGQNVFDDATSFAGEWRADETAAELIAAGKIPPIIIVAIENAGAGRIQEYTPTPDPKESAGGGAKDYADFLLSEVKPYVDANFRTLKEGVNTGVCGSSLGGLVSLYICDRLPDVFGLCGAVSPSLWWDNRELLLRISRQPQALAKCRVWVDMGTDEGSGVEPSANVANVKELSRILERAGMTQGKNLKLQIIDGAGHNESAWARRFGEILVFLFGSR